MAGRPEPPSPEEPTWILYGDQQRRQRRTGLVLGGVFVAVLAGGWVLAERDPSPSTSSTSSTVSEVDSETRTQVARFTTAGTRALAAAVRETTGSTRVLEAILFPATAVVVVPDGAGTPQRYEWDGTRLRHAGDGASFREPFDLTAVDGDLLGRLCGDPTQACTVVAGRPLAGEDGVWLTVTGADGVRRTDLRGVAR